MSRKLKNGHSRISSQTAIIKFGVSIPPGEVVYQTHEAENIVTWLNEDKIVVKAKFMQVVEEKLVGLRFVKMTMR